MKHPEEQCVVLCIKDIVNEVITLQEASEILGIADSTLRKKVLNGDFKDWEYRKTTKMIIFNKTAILERKVKKNK